jgi:hypothetical protein
MPCRSDLGIIRLHGRDQATARFEQSRDLREAPHDAFIIIDDLMQPGNDDESLGQKPVKIGIGERIAMFDGGFNTRRRSVLQCLLDIFIAIIAQRRLHIDSGTFEPAQCSNQVAPTATSEIGEPEGPDFVGSFHRFRDNDIAQQFAAIANAGPARRVEIDAVDQLPDQKAPFGFVVIDMVQNMTPESKP